MGKRLARAVVAGCLAAALLTACTEDGGVPAGGPRTGTGAAVGVILTEATTAARWTKQDPGYFKDAFRGAGVSADIRNAGDDDFEKIADEMISGGAKVIIILSPDGAAGKAVITRAHQEKVKVIDYDRLSVGGGADYFVGFDPEEMGRMQAYGLVKCLGGKTAANPVVAELNGAPTDSNAAGLVAGHEFVMEPRYANAQYTMGPSQYVPDWDPAQAEDIFHQMIKQQPGIDGVLAADDGIANAVIGVLRGLKRNGKVPVTGQNATIDGLHNLLTGDQCMTVYKRIKLEAQTAANIAVQLVKGIPPAIGGALRDPESDQQIPFSGLAPLPITVDEVKDVVANGFVTAKQLCTGTYQALCREHGVT